MATFDTFAANYQELVSENIRITGESPDYFAAYKARYIARRAAPPPGGKILDYGCGVGLLALHLKEVLVGRQVDGFDVSKESIERVNQLLQREGTFTTNLDTLDCAYDVIVLSNVLHHVKPAEPAVKTLTDGWRSLCWAAVAFHSNRPSLSLRPVSGPYGFLCLLHSPARVPASRSASST